MSFAHNARYSWRKYDGSIVGDRGMCADIAGASAADGTPVIAYPCRGQWNDTFFRNPASSFELFKTSTNDRCLNVRGGTAPNPLIGWSCGAFENERFTTVGVEWRSMGGLCVQAVGNVLDVRACWGAAAQKWQFFHPVAGLRHDQIRFVDGSGASACVTAQTVAGRIGEQLALVPCAENDLKQRFSQGARWFLSGV
jgi:hypothetical protein